MLRILLLALGINAAGCVVGTDGKPRVLMSVGPLDGGACAYGGELVSSGVDTNGDGVLQADEITSAFPLCGATRLESGVVTANYTTPNWNLAEGTGDRAFTTPVTFPTRFDALPTVVVSLRDIDCSAPERVSVTASAIDQSGFTLTIRTWEGSLVNGVVVSWLAYAP